MLSYKGIQLNKIKDFSVIVMLTLSMQSAMSFPDRNDLLYVAHDRSMSAYFSAPLILSFSVCVCICPSVPPQF